MRRVLSYGSGVENAREEDAYEELDDGSLDQGMNTV